TCGGVSIPSNAAAIAGIFTVVNQLNNFGYGTLYPTGGSVPNTANLNYTPMGVAFNSFITGLSVGGQFNLFAFTTVHVVIDVAGYFAPLPTNQAPVVEAGADQTITLTSGARLAGN